jgi:hypothetical protein
VKLGSTENGRNFGQGVENATAEGDGKEARGEHGVQGSLKGRGNYEESAAVKLLG